MVTQGLILCKNIPIIHREAVVGVPTNFIETIQTCK